jgi:hypothetical protein
VKSIGNPVANLVSLFAFALRLLKPSLGRSAVSDRNASYWLRRISKGNWSAHDMRKLARTSWAVLGIDYTVTEQLLNHSMSKLDKAYIHTIWNSYPL